MKFNNKTLRAAVKEWLNDTSSAEATYGHISSWDTSKVTDMSELFKNKIKFNQPIGDWDVSNVTNMGYMFSDAEAFNQPIGNWDVGNVTNMNNMFSDAEGRRKGRRKSAFNQDIGNWDVSNVSNMSRMFFDNQAFNQPIGNWDVSNVTKMNRIFEGATSFKQDIENWNIIQDGDIEIEEHLSEPSGTEDQLDQILDQKAIDYLDVLEKALKKVELPGETSNFSEILSNWKDWKDRKAKQSDIKKKDK
jgi:surface protein